MLDNGRISSVQLLFIFLIFEASTAILYTPARVATLAGPDSWLAVSLGDVFYGLLVLLVAVALGKRFPDQVFTGYLPEILGQVAGKLLAAVYALIFIHLGSVMLNEGSTFIQLTLLSLTPPVVLDTVLIAIAIYGAYLGIEVIARENGIVLPVWLLMVGLLFALAATEMDFSNLKPVFENGLLPVLRAGLFHGGWRGEVFLLLMLYPYLNQKHEALKTGLLYLGSAMILAGAGQGVIVGVLGGPVTAHLIYPFEVLVGYISLGNWLERLEIVASVFLIAAFIIKLAIIYHTAGIAVASTLGLKNYRITLIPIALMAIILSRVFLGTYLKLSDYLFHPWPIEAPIVELAIPALILLLAVIRKKAAPEAVRHSARLRTPGGAQSTPALAGGDHLANP
jgi:spore germination protein KB